jgi:hypothetical protein
VTALWLLAACWIPEVPDPVQTPLDTDTAGDPCALYTWDVVGGPFVRTWCAPCHSADLPAAQRSGAPTTVTLDTETDVIANMARVRGTAQAGSMPPGGGPEAPEVERFVRYLDCL